MKTSIERLTDKLVKEDTENTLADEFIKANLDCYPYISNIKRYHNVTWVKDSDIEEIQANNRKIYNSFNLIPGTFLEYIDQVYKNNMRCWFVYQSALIDIKDQPKDFLEINSFTNIIDFANELFGEMVDFTKEESEIIDKHIMKLIKNSSI